MDVGVDIDDQKGDWQIIFFSGQTVCSVWTKINELQGNSDIYLECRTLNLFMYDFISEEIYLKSKIYQELIPTRHNPHFFCVHLFISGPLQEKYSIQRNSITKNGKKWGLSSAEVITQTLVKELKMYVSIIQNNPDYAK